MTAVPGNEHGELGEQDALNESERLRRLDQLDELLRHFRPIEQLLLLMGKVDPDAVGAGELVLNCAEIGLHLAGQFRKELERVFGRDGGQGGETEAERLG